VTLGLAVALVLAFLLSNGYVEALDAGRLQAFVRSLGAWGPLALIAMMVAAILVSPVPSAPIALAAGAAYGHVWGTLYVALGSELGAICAFLLARFLGHEFVQRRFGDVLGKGLVGSQNALTVTVLVSRLMPFISFDIISYAAGLTVLSFWRFALATLAGILPASFALAHVGAQLGSADDAASAALLVGVLGIVGISPVVIRAWRRHRA
jgi:uncharacterized membrane protein YdjX (TVP38/TMEM64 family)